MNLVEILNIKYIQLLHNRRLKLPLFIFVAIILSALTQGQVFAQPAQKITRVLFLLDGSSSMLDNWNSQQTRFQAAGKLVGYIADSIRANNSKVEFAIRVFGHQHYVQDKDCSDSRLEVSFSQYNIEQIKIRLEHISPKGVSPIAWSLKESVYNDFERSNKYAYSLILITDGGESCGGNICETMQTLVNKSINFQPYIISMLEYEPLKSEYDCMGKYMTVKNERDFENVIQTLLKDNNNFYADENTKYVPKDHVTIIPPTKTEPVITRPPINIEVTTPTKTTLPVIDSPKNNRSKKILTKLELPNKPQVSSSDYKMVASKPPRIKVSPLPTFSVPVTEEPAQELIIKKLAITKLKGTPKPDKIDEIYVFSDAKSIRVRPLPPISIPNQVIVQQPKQTTQPTQTTQPKREIKADVPPKTETVANNTPTEPGKLSLYFTDGKGKYYYTQPKIQITNINTSNTAYSGQRKVTSGRTPSPIELPKGRYKITIPGANNTATFNISDGQDVKVEIVVDKGTLSFRYNTNGKPPEGYIAIVSKRFESGDLYKQPTDEIFEYESSNYHIEINTLPPSIFNIDLLFGEERIITILKEGLFEVMNENEIGRVKLLCERGTQFVPFFEMNILGDVAYQKLKLLPGRYKAIYNIKTPQGAHFSRTKDFSIISDKSTQLTLD